MAIHLEAKAPTGVSIYTWTPKLDEGDGIAAPTLTVSTGTATISSYEDNGEEVEFTLTGGADGETTAIAASVTTDLGETLVETIYIPITVSTSAAQTVRDVVYFALRKVAGLGVDPTANEAEDAREILEDMLRAWRDQGADIGVPDTLTLSTQLYCPNWALSALKNNLRVQIADLYGAEVSPVVYRNAMAGLQQVKMHNLPDTRTTVYY